MNLAIPKLVRRDLKFPLDPARIGNWHGDSHNASHLLNSLSVLFPHGEMFFIRSVRHYRDHGAISDAALKADIKAFIGQEAMHSREHIDYNNHLNKMGFAADKKEAFVGALLKRVRQITTPSWRLAITVSLEHLTASLADEILKNEQPFGVNADPTFADAWRWHAVEETEHKAVAWDVYTLAVPNPVQRYCQRTISMTLAHIIFWPVVIGFWLDMSRRAGDLTNLSDWRKTARSLFGGSVNIAAQLPALLQYYKPSFHPWQHDNRQLLQHVDSLVERYAATK